MSQFPSVNLPPEARLYLLNHVFLPPELPQEDDYDATHESILLDTAVDALHQFEALVSEHHRESVDPVTKMVVLLRSTRGSDGQVNELRLKHALATLNSSGNVLPIHIPSQNSAVLMTRKDDTIHIETFELSPQNSAVISTVGRLRRQFPGPSFALD
ncbi:hypothetical protein BJY00DRAFT_314871 [Aspergillus carlsbadensis]|nr:hypothetical protein BJY00DRAFT_314871 [Aspergillus carlsbadensis]